MPYKNKKDAITRYKKYYRIKSQYIKEYKLSRGCSRCGYNKCPDALVFHHNGDKEFEIGECNSFSLMRLTREMNKCEILCANCHAELHFELKNNV